MNTIKKKNINSPGKIILNYPILDPHLPLVIVCHWSVQSLVS